MKWLFLLALLLHVAAGAAAPLVDEGAARSGKGRHIVLLAGNLGSCSEETLPTLWRGLAKHRGFEGRVLFTVDPATGEIVPGRPPSRHERRS